MNGYPTEVLFSVVTPAVLLHLNLTTLCIWSKSANVFNEAGGKKWGGKEAIEIKAEREPWSGEKLLNVESEKQQDKREAAFVKEAALKDSDRGSSYQINPSNSNTKEKLKGSTHLWRSDLRCVSDANERRNLEKNWINAANQRPNIAIKQSQASKILRVMLECVKQEFPSCLISDRASKTWAYTSANSRAGIMRWIQTSRLLPETAVAYFKPHSVSGWWHGFCITSSSSLVLLFRACQRVEDDSSLISLGLFASRVCLGSQPSSLLESQHHDTSFSKPCYKGVQVVFDREGSNRDEKADLFPCISLLNISQCFV